MIVLDTTVLVYAKGADHVLRDPCRRLLATVAVGRTSATTTAEVVQEFVHVRAGRRGRTDAAALGRDYAQLFADLLPIANRDLQRGLALFVAHPNLDLFDAVLAASAMPAGTLVSADRAFAQIAGLVHVYPDEAVVSALVDGDPG